MDIKEKVRACLEECGIVIHDDGTIEQMDSINYVTAILSLEEAFDIEFPDEFLNFEIMVSLNKVKDTVEIIIKREREEKED